MMINRPIEAPLSNRTQPPAPDSTRPLVSVTNRQAMPTVADVIDQLRAVFGPVKVIFAEEAGHKLGKKPDPGVIAYPPHVPGKSRKQG